MTSYIYFCRSSFCMGDDVYAPNLKKFEYSPKSFSEEDFRNCIASYFSSDMPSLEWHGFCNGKFIACVQSCGEGENYHLHIELADNWASTLDTVRSVFFDHHIDDSYKPGINDSKYFTCEKIAEMFKHI